MNMFKQLTDRIRQSLGESTLPASRITFPKPGSGTYEETATIALHHWLYQSGGLAGNVFGRTAGPGTEEELISASHELQSVMAFGQNPSDHKRVQQEFFDQCAKEKPVDFDAGDLNTAGTGTAQPKVKRPSATYQQVQIDCVAYVDERVVNQLSTSSNVNVLLPPARTGTNEYLPAMEFSQKCLDLILAHKQFLVRDKTGVVAEHDNYALLSQTAIAIRPEFHGNHSLRRVLVEICADTTRANVFVKMLQLEKDLRYFSTRDEMRSLLLEVGGAIEIHPLIVEEQTAFVAIVFPTDSQGHEWAHEVLVKYKWVLPLLYRLYQRGKFWYITIPTVNQMAFETHFEVLGLREQVHRLEQQNYVLELQIQDLRDQVRRLEQQNHVLELQMQDLRDQVQDLRDQLQDLRDQLQDLRDQLQDLRSEIREVRSEIREFRSEVAGLRALILERFPSRES